MDVYYGHGSLHTGQSTRFPKGKWSATEGAAESLISLISFSRTGSSGLGEDLELFQFSSEEDHAWAMLIEARGLGASCRQGEARLSWPVRGPALPDSPGGCLV